MTDNRFDIWTSKVLPQIFSQFITKNKFWLIKEKYPIMSNWLYTVLLWHMSICDDLIKHGGFFTLMVPQRNPSTIKIYLCWKQGGSWVCAINMTHAVQCITLNYLYFHPTTMCLWERKTPKHKHSHSRKIWAISTIEVDSSVKQK